MNKTTSVSLSVENTTKLREIATADNPIGKIVNRIVAQYLKEQAAKQVKK